VYDIEVKYLTVCFYLCCLVCSIESFQPREGEPFKIIEGYTLDNTFLSLPIAAHGRYAVIALGFSKAAQTPINSWFLPLKERYKASSLLFYEVPMLGKRSALVRRFIEKGMRSGIPAYQHASSVPYYGSLNPYLTYYGIDNKETAYFFLVDENGRICWQAQGVRTASFYKEVTQLVDTALVLFAET